MSDGESRLWFEELIVLDNDSGTQADEWLLSPEKYIRYGQANQAMLTMEYRAMLAAPPARASTSSAPRRAAARKRSSRT